MIEIKSLNSAELAAYIDSPNFQTLSNLPISRHRAKAHLLNPRANPEDILLFLALLEGEIVGYLGLLPDHYFVAGIQKKCCWFTCLWVSEKQRGKSIAKMLLNKGYEVSHGHALLAEFAPIAKGLYERIGYFSVMEDRPGIRLYYRLSLHQILAPKHAIFRQLKPVLKAFDGFCNVLIDEYKKLFSSKKSAVSYKYSEAITPTIAAFIEDKNGDELFRRTALELDWAIKNPWVLSGPPDEMSRRYYFSSVDKSFDFISIEVYDAEMHLAAFLVLAKRDRTLKLPCCYLRENSVSLAAAVIDQHIQQWGINTFSTYHPAMVQHYQKNQPLALYHKSLKRIYFATNQMIGSLDKQAVVVQDGDGDCFFT